MSVLFGPAGNSNSFPYKSSVDAPRWLREIGLDAYEYQCGKGVNVEETAALEPDVVILDIIMPKMDGLSVMEKFSHNANVKKVPVFIVLSAIGQERITEDAFSLGADYYVLKPFDNTTLLNRI